ncbi:hypothetical protein [Stenotrophomonas oahuensis]|uniref:Transmembrane protein n=1 Tax=Stenotrophomonas oahuensis TaxID=3003271 RepID=A0ABY9YVE3_9GAMM|nr:hypothetical protein [Stenotrophomonas sp. A5586]WNH54525.1 hypothetical protein PDM29_09700 [Stenotrophomonas sp. A5586]
MEENSPYLAGKAELSTAADGSATGVPGEITRPITYLWILLAVQTGIAVVWGGYQVLTAPSMALFLAAIFGMTAVINAACAFGVYNRVYWVAVVVTVLYGLSLVMELFSLLKGTPSIFALIVGVVTTIIGVRGTQAIRDYHSFVAASRKRRSSPSLADDPAFAQKQDA